MKSHQIGIQRARPRPAIARRSLVIVVLQCILSASVLSGVAAADSGASAAGSTTSGSNLVVWDDISTVKGAFVGSGGSVGGTFDIALGGGTPSAATDGTDHLVVWAQSTDNDECFSNGQEIYGAIVKAGGTVGESFPIATADGPCDVVGYYPSLDSLISPRAGFDGTNYLVVWNGWRDPGQSSIEGARVTTEGAVLDPGGVALVLAPESNYYAYPRLAFDGTNFLVVFRRADYLCWCGNKDGIYVTRVSTAATPVALDPQGIPIVLHTTSLTHDPDYGGVAFDGENWIVVWTQSKYWYNDTPMVTQSGLMAARVSQTGVVLDPLGTKIADLGDTDGDGPAVVSNGNRVLVAWGGNYSPNARALLLESSLAGGIDVVTPTFSLPLGDPEGALSVDQFLLVGDSISSSWPPSVGGIRIGFDGEIVDPQPFRISTPDTTPPDTTISSGPAVLSNETTATFEFAADENAWFECQLDSQPSAPCSSPQTYDALGDVSHRFEVVATDRAGNLETTPAQWEWTIDTAAPETNISAGPSGLTNQGTATFSFTSTEAGSSFECSVDEAAFSGCSSPVVYSELGDGLHTFNVRAVDGAGNVDGTPTSRVWTIDTTAPDPAVLLAPADSSSTTNARPTFDWSDLADDSGVSYEFQLDNSGSEFTSAEISENGLTTSSFTSNNQLAAGTYAWRVRASDGAGNIGDWSNVFTVTITVPPGTIAGTVTSATTKKGIAGATVNCGAAGTTTTTSNGSYSLANVTPGSYSCTASASGHKPLTKSVIVKSNSTATATFALKKA